MDELFPKKWHWNAIVLFAIAICAQCVSLRIAGAAAELSAKSVEKSDPMLGNDALWRSIQSDRCHIAGLMLGIAAIACWGISLWDGEPGRQSVVVVLLSAWLLVYFVIV